MKFTVQKEITLNFFIRLQKENDKHFIWYRDINTGLTMKEHISIITYRTLKKELGGKDVV